MSDIDASATDAAAVLEWAWVPERADYTAAVRVCRSPRVRWLAGLYLVLGALCLLLGTTADGGAGIGVGVGLIILAAFALLLAPRLSARRFFAEDVLSNQRRVRVAPEGLTVRTPNGTSTTYWHAYFACTRVGDLYLLRLRRNTKRGPRPGAFVVLASRGLHLPGDPERLNALLSTYLSVPVQAR